MKINLFITWFYSGPYVPSGVLYGKRDKPSYCHWLVPGFVDPDGAEGFARINLYEVEK